MAILRSNEDGLSLEQVLFVYTEELSKVQYPEPC